MNDDSGDDEKDGLTSGWEDKSRQDWWGWRNEYGSWCQRRDDAYLNERSVTVIFKEEMVGGRERSSDNRWGASTARRLKRDKVVKIARLSGCKNFVGKRKKFIFDAFVDLQPVEMANVRLSVCLFVCRWNTCCCCFLLCEKVRQFVLAAGAYSWRQ